MTNSLLARTAATLAAVAGALLLPAAATAAVPTPTDPGLIAYSTGGSQYVQSIWPNGTRQQATLLRGTVGNWSRDGGYLATATPDTRVWPWAAFGGSTTAINGFPIGTTQPIGPSFSSDRNLVAYGSAGGLRVWDKNAPQINNSTLLDANPAQRTSWAGGTDYLVWEGGSPAGIWVRHASSNRRLVGGTTPSIAQNGSLVAYVDAGVIRVIDPTSMTDTSVAIGGNDATASDSLPALSPDGSKVAFVSDRDGTPAIFVAPADASGAAVKVANTTTASGITGVAWQPSSQPTAAAISITGTAHEGSTLNADYAASAGAQPLVSSYVWQRCPADGNLAGCVDVVEGEWEMSYNLTTADVGHTVRVLRRAENPAGRDDEPSALTAVVADVTPPATPTLGGLPSGPTTERKVVITVTKGESGGTLECSLDGAQAANCASPIVIDGLNPGDHELKVVHRDASGNAGQPAVATWTVLAPAAPDAPQTPEAPATEPTFTAVVGPVGDKAGGSAGATVVVRAKSVGVECRMTGVALASCEVDLYAEVGGDATAARRVLVGTGRTRADAKTGKLEVVVKLNATGRALLRRSPEGLDVAVAISGKSVTGSTLEAKGSARLVAKRRSAVLGGFAVDSAELPAGVRRALRQLSRGLGAGARVTVVGHTDASSSDAGYLRRLGLARARAVERYLAARGVKGSVRVASRAATQPRATNETRQGRALNRRVVLTIVR